MSKSKFQKFGTSPLTPQTKTPKINTTGMPDKGHITSDNTVKIPTYGAKPPKAKQETAKELSVTPGVEIDTPSAPKPTGMGFGTKKSGTHKAARILDPGVKKENLDIAREQKDSLNMRDKRGKLPIAIKSEDELDDDNEQKTDKFKKVMDEYKSGTLKMPNGNKVANRQQALAIAFNESGLNKSEVVEVLYKAAEGSLLKDKRGSDSSPSQETKKDISPNIADMASKEEKTTTNMASKEEKTTTNMASKAEKTTTNVASKEEKPTTNVASKEEKPTTNVASKEEKPISESIKMTGTRPKIEPQQEKQKNIQSTKAPEEPKLNVKQEEIKSQVETKIETPNETEDIKTEEIKTTHPKLEDEDIKVTLKNYAKKNKLNVDMINQNIGQTDPTVLNDEVLKGVPGLLGREGYKSNTKEALKYHQDSELEKPSTHRSAILKNIREGKKIQAPIIAISNGNKEIISGKDTIFAYKDAEALGEKYGYKSEFPKVLFVNLDEIKSKKETTQDQEILSDLETISRDRWAEHEATWGKSGEQKKSKSLFEAIFGPFGGKKSGSTAQKESPDIFNYEPETQKIKGTTQYYPQNVKEKQRETVTPTMNKVKAMGPAIIQNMSKIAKEIQNYSVKNNFTEEKALQIAKAAFESYKKVKKYESTIKTLEEKRITPENFASAVLYNDWGHTGKEQKSELNTVNDIIHNTKKMLSDNISGGKTLEEIHNSLSKLSEEYKRITGKDNFYDTIVKPTLGTYKPDDKNILDIEQLVSQKIKEENKKEKKNNNPLAGTVYELKNKIPIKHLKTALEDKDNDYISRVPEEYLMYIKEAKQIDDKTFNELVDIRHNTNTQKATKEIEILEAKKSNKLINDEKYSDQINIIKGMYGKEIVSNILELKKETDNIKKREEALKSKEFNIGKFERALLDPLNSENSQYLKDLKPKIVEKFKNRINPINYYEYKVIRLNNELERKSGKDREDFLPIHKRLKEEYETKITEAQELKNAEPEVGSDKKYTDIEPEFTEKDDKNIIAIQNVLKGNSSQEDVDTVKNIKLYEWQKYSEGGWIKKGDYKKIHKKIPKEKGSLRKIPEMDKKLKEKGTKEYSPESDSDLSLFNSVMKKEKILDFFSKSLTHIKREKNTEKFNEHRKAAIGKAFNVHGYKSPSDQDFIKDPKNDLVYLNPDFIKKSKIDDESKNILSAYLDKNTDDLSLTGSYLYNKLSTSEKDNLRLSFNKYDMDIRKINEPFLKASLDYAPFHKNIEYFFKFLIAAKETPQEAVLGNKLSYLFGVKGGSEVQIPTELEDIRVTDVDNNDITDEDEKEIGEGVETETIEIEEGTETKIKDDIKDTYELGVNTKNGAINQEESYDIEPENSEDDYIKKRKEGETATQQILSAEELTTPLGKKQVLKQKESLSDVVSCILLGKNPFTYNYEFFYTIEPYLDNDTKQKIKKSSSDIEKYNPEEISISQGSIDKISKIDPNSLSILTEIGGNLSAVFSEAIKGYNLTKGNPDAAREIFGDICKKFDLPEYFKESQDKMLDDSYTNINKEDIFGTNLVEYHRGGDYKYTTLSKKFAAKDIEDRHGVKIIINKEIGGYEGLKQSIILGIKNAVVNNKKMSKTVTDKIDSKLFSDVIGLPINDKKNREIRDAIESDEVLNIGKTISKILNPKNNKDIQNKINWGLQQMVAESQSDKSALKSIINTLKDKNGLIKKITNKVEDLEEGDTFISDKANDDLKTKLLKKRARLWFNKTSPFETMDKDDILKKFKIESFREYFKYKYQVDEGGNNVEEDPTFEKFRNYIDLRDRFQALLSNIYNTGTTVLDKNNKIAKEYNEIKKNLIDVAKNVLNFSKEEIEVYKKKIDDFTEHMLDNYIRKEVQILNKNREYKKKGIPKAIFISQDEDVLYLNDYTGDIKDQSLTTKYAIVEIERVDKSPLKIKKETENEDGTKKIEMVDAGVSSELKIDCNDILGGHVNRELTKEYLDHFPWINKQTDYFEIEDEEKTFDYNNIRRTREGEFTQAIVDGKFKDKSLTDLSSDEVLSLLNEIDSEDSKLIDEINKTSNKNRVLTAQSLNLCDINIEDENKIKEIENYIVKNIEKIVDPKNENQVAKGIANNISIDVNMSKLFDHLGPIHLGEYKDKIKELISNPIFKNIKKGFSVSKNPQFGYTIDQNLLKNTLIDEFRNKKINKKEKDTIMGEIDKLSSFKEFLESSYPEDMSPHQKIEPSILSACKDFVSLLRNEIKKDGKKPIIIQKLLEKEKENRTGEKVKNTGVFLGFNRFLTTYLDKLKDPTVWEEMDFNGFMDVKEDLISYYKKIKRNENDEISALISKDSKMIESMGGDSTNNLEDFFRYTKDKDIDKFKNAGNFIIKNLGLSQTDNEAILREAIKNETSIADELIKKVDNIRPENLSLLYDLGDKITEKDSQKSPISLYQKKYGTSTVYKPLVVLGTEIKEIATKLINKKQGIMGLAENIDNGTNKILKYESEKVQKKSKKHFDIYMDYISKQEVVSQNIQPTISTESPVIAKKLLSLNGLVSASLASSIVNLESQPLYVSEMTRKDGENGLSAWFLKGNNLEKIVKLYRTQVGKGNRSVLEHLSRMPKGKRYENEAKKYKASWLPQDVLKKSNIINNLKRSERLIYSFTKNSFNLMGVELSANKLRNMLIKNNYDAIRTIKSYFIGNTDKVGRLGYLTSAAGLMSNPSLNLDMPFSKKANKGKINAIAKLEEQGVPIKTDPMFQEQPVPASTTRSKMGYQTEAEFGRAASAIFQKDLLSGNLVGVFQLPPKVLSSMMHQVVENISKVIPYEPSKNNTGRIGLNIIPQNKKNSLKLIDMELKMNLDDLGVESKSVPIMDYLESLGFEKKAQEVISKKLDNKQIEKLHKARNHPEAFNYLIEKFGLKFKKFDSSNTLTPEIWKKNGNKLYHLLADSTYASFNYAKMSESIKMATLSSINDSMILSDKTIPKKLNTILSLKSKDSVYLNFAKKIKNILTDLSKIKPENIENFNNKYNIEVEFEDDTLDVSNYLSLRDSAKYFMDTIEDKRDLGVIVDMFGFYHDNLKSLFPMMLENITQDEIKRAIYNK